MEKTPEESPTALTSELGRAKFRHSILRLGSFSARLTRQPARVPSAAVTKEAAAPKKNLIYTIAFDLPGESMYGMMAKLLVSSAIRSGFSGELLILRNGRDSLFDQKHSQLTEVRFETPAAHPASLATAAKQMKYKAFHFLNLEAYEKIMFVDVDCLFLRNPDSLFRSDADIAYTEEEHHNITYEWHCAYLTDEEMATLRRPAINSGCWWVRSEYFPAVMTEWRKINRRPPLRPRRCSDQSAWVRLVLDASLRAQPFPSKAIGFPHSQKKTMLEHEAATVLHFTMTHAAHRLASMYGFYMRRFETSSMSALLESL